MLELTNKERYLKNMRLKNAQASFAIYFEVILFFQLVNSEKWNCLIQ